MAHTVYFHTSTNGSLDAGTILERGKWWREITLRDWRKLCCKACYRAYDKFVVETVFEEVRRALQPRAQSRLECVFLWSSLDDAMDEEHLPQKDGDCFVYRVAVDPGAELFQGSYHLVGGRRLR